MGNSGTVACYSATVYRNTVLLSVYSVGKDA